MASSTDVKLKIQVESGAAEKSLGELEKDFNKLNESLEELRLKGREGSKLFQQLEKNSEALGKVIEKRSGTLGGMNHELELMKGRLTDLKVGSKEFNDLATEIAQAERKVKNLELSFEALDNEQVASELGSVAGAVGDVSAAFILLGDDSETLQEVAKNIELAMGLSMGLKGAIEGVSSARKLLTNSTKIQTLAEKARNLVSKEGIIVTTAAIGVEKLSNFVKVGAFATNAQLAASETARGAATAGATVATTAATAATKLFRLALIATGIGAIIVALGLLIANFDKVKEAMGKVVDFIYKSFKPQIDLVISALEFLGLKETEEAKKRKALHAREIKQREQEAKAKMDLINKEIEANKKLTDEVTAALDFELRKRQAAGEDTAELEEQKIKILIESARKEIELINQKIAAKAKELEFSKGAMAGLVAANIEAYKAQQEAQKENINAMLQDLEVFHIEQRRLARDAAKDIEKINDKVIEERFEKKKLENIALGKQEILTTKKTNEELLAIYLENQKKIDDAREQARLERQEKLREDLDNAANLIGSLTTLNNTALEAELAGAGDNEQKKQEIRKKAFARDKALKIAEATITGIQAVQSALASPFPFNIALAAINGATALANITKIARTQFEGSGGGGSVPSSLGNTSRGSGGANVGQVTNTTTTIGEPTRVYVTEQDISNTQNKVSVNEAQATI